MMEEEQREDPVEEQPAPAEEQPAEEAPSEEPKEETPVEEAPAEESPSEPVGETPVEEAPAEESGEEKECGCCSGEGTKSAEDAVRDLVNLVNVYKEEEKEGVTTRIDPATADELVAKLEELAQKVGNVCQ